MTPIEKITQVLVAAKQDIDIILKSEALPGSLDISLGAGLEALIGRVSFLNGGPMVQTKQTHVFGPLTEFMGEPITVRKDLRMEELSPTPTEKDAYIAKVEKLYKDLSTMSAATLLDAYTNADDVEVLRGVALRAGVVDYEDAPINEDFISQVKAGIQANAEQKRNEINFETGLSKEVKPEIKLSAEEVKALQDDLGITKPGNNEPAKINPEVLGTNKSLATLDDLNIKPPTV